MRGQTDHAQRQARDQRRNTDAAERRDRKEVTLRFPQRGDLAQHPDAVAREADFAAFVVVPADRDFFHPEVRFSRAIQELDIEAEAVGLRRLKDGTENIEAKRLEAALRVPKWKTGREPDDEIEYATALFSSP